MMAVGTPELIRDMRRGRVPSVERFRALCEVLGLEFYVGRPRSEWLPEPDRLELAIMAAENASEISRHTLTHAEKARVASTVYELIDMGPVGSDKAAMRIFGLIELIVSERSTEPSEHREGQHASSRRILPLRRRP